MDSINPLSPRPPVGSATSQGRGQGQQAGQNQPAQGQLLKALVLQARSESQFLLEIGNNRVTAQSETPLRVGQTLQLQVTNTSPQIELKIVTDTLNQFIGKSITLLGKNIDLTQLFKGLQSLSPPPLENLTPTSKSILDSFFSLQQTNINSSEGGPVLKQLIENLGLNFENLLAQGNKQGAVNTLKAALLELAHTFGTAERIAETTTKLLTTLELFQFSQLHSNSDTHLIFPIPLPFVEQGYLVIERDANKDDKDQESETENKFSLHITMSELGHLHIDFLQNNESLLIRFKTESREKLEFIQQFSEELIEAISGVPRISITFSEDAPDPIHELIREMIPEGSSMLDTKV